MYKVFFKRFLDFFCAIVLLVLISPIFLSVSVILAIANSGSPFFLQERPGKGGRIFKVIKFKTMNDKKDADGILLPDRQRLTPAGTVIRKTSLDELPQLINVIKNDMSFIGPRPLLKNYLPFYTPLELTRHDVVPGITGWAQVNGRNNLDWDTRLAYDVCYVNNISFALDAKIVVMTIKNIFASKDVNIVPGEKMLNLDHERKVRS